MYDYAYYIEGYLSVSNVDCINIEMTQFARTSITSCNNSFFGRILVKKNVHSKRTKKKSATVPRVETLGEIDFRFLSHWKECDRRCSFPFDYEPNGSSLSS